MGNRVVLVPSQRLPWIAADWVQLLETSDIPAGVVNLVTGQRDELAPVLAAHADVDALWCLDAAPELATQLETLSAINLKRTWIDACRQRRMDRRRVGRTRALPAPGHASQECLGALRYVTSGPACLARIDTPAVEVDQCRRAAAAWMMWVFIQQRVEP